MKKLLLALAIILSFSSMGQTNVKTTTFLQDYADYDGKLFSFALAKINGGDTVSTKAPLLAAMINLDNKWNVADEMAKVPPILILCQWMGSNIFYNCTRATMAPSLDNCWREYYTWMAFCGLIPVRPDLKK